MNVAGVSLNQLIIVQIINSAKPIIIKSNANSASFSVAE